MSSRRIAWLAGALALLAAGSREAAAQCSMCSQSAQAAASPDQVARTFGLAVLVLLVPVVLALAGAGLLLWKFREGAGSHSSNEPSPGRSPASSPLSSPSGPSPVSAPQSSSAADFDRVPATANRDGSRAAFPPQRGQGAEAGVLPGGTIRSKRRRHFPHPNS